MDEPRKEAARVNAPAAMGAQLAAEALAKKLCATSLEKEATLKPSNIGQASQEEASTVEMTDSLPGDEGGKQQTAGSYRDAL